MTRDALLVTHLPNIRYLTGYTGSAALLLIGETAATLITDFRYAVQAPAEQAIRAGPARSPPLSGAACRCPS